MISEDNWMTKIATIAANLATMRKSTLYFLRKANQEDEEKMPWPKLMDRYGLNLPSLEQGMFGQPMDHKLS